MGNLSTGHLKAIAAALLLFGGWWTIPAGAAAAKPPKLTLKTTATATVQTQIIVSGKAPAAAGKRPAIRIERRTGNRWTLLQRGKADRNHRYSIVVTAPSSPQQLVLRAKVLRGKRVVATSSTRTVNVTVRPAPIQRPLTGSAPPIPQGPSVLPTPDPQPDPGPTPGDVPPPGPAPTTPDQPAPTTPTGPEPLRVTGSSVELTPGARALLPSTAPLVAMTSISKPHLLPAGVTLAGDGATEEFSLTASPQVQAGTTQIQLAGVGCVAARCDVDFRLTFTLDVRSIEAPTGQPVNAFTVASAARIQRADVDELGGRQLDDQLTITLGTPDVPGSRARADEIAASVGAVVSGGIEDVGVYELRWVAPQDIAARITEIEAMAGVAQASPTVIRRAGEQATPNDWDDDGPDGIWPFKTVLAEAAWDRSTGSSIRVGVVDVGNVYREHEDLSVVKTFGSQNAQEHATHVAGLACARQNGRGVVGMAWGCPIVSAAAGVDADSYSDDLVFEAASDAVDAGARVVNLSLGVSINGQEDCDSDAETDVLQKYIAKQASKFQNLFQGKGKEVIWTLSAGNNCNRGPASPWGLAWKLPNVFTVAASNSDDRLARYSNYGKGVEIAAPGGLGPGDVGVWSTSIQSCDFWRFRSCSTYQRMDGTSMAAPMVAGIAALVMQAHPTFDADTVAACIRDTAGLTRTVTALADKPNKALHTSSPFSSSDAIPIVNAAAAVACEQFDSSDASAYAGSWTNGGWLLDMRVAADGTLNATNQTSTSFVNGCSTGPGLLLFKDLALTPSGVWAGKTVTTSDYCSTFGYVNGGAAMRAIRTDEGAVRIVIAWSTSSVPTIDADGTVHNAYASTVLRRPS